MNISIEARTLHFKQPAGTSRGVYTQRKIWLVEIEENGRRGIGECAPLPDLSCDVSADYEAVLRGFCDRLEQTNAIDYEALRPYPSMLFGIETALKSLQNDLIFDTPFARGEEGIPINGLVWMGTFEEMQARIEEKLEAGFGCVKLKIGAIDFEQELSLIRQIRRRFTKAEVELRVDANGAFRPEAALDRIKLLAGLDIHSIEQPIRQGQWPAMARLCRETPLPIALDEELIGGSSLAEKACLLDTIRPQYLVLKPSLHGGMHGCREWIALARQRNIGTWLTSALESNIGLNAIAQFCSDVYGRDIRFPQGLGTGRLFTDNIPMPLEIRGDRLWICRRS
ncbi:MAG: o-succinylbenzoate synthase [Prevotella sp.]|nr:o-succinylbenzoate synthase [Prevotella sp.]